MKLKVEIMYEYYGYQDIYDCLFENGRYNYRRWAMEPNMLDVPIDKIENRKIQVRKFKLYNIAYMEAESNNDVEAMDEIQSFDWEEIFDQPLSRLVLICGLIGIDVYVYNREVVLKALKEYNFINEDSWGYQFLQNEIDPNISTKE